MAGKPATKHRPQLGSGLPPLRPGMPALDRVKEVADFVSPQGDKYKILKTTETDAYDPPLASPKKPRKPRPTA